jgi:mono/diheme cytochrome c family protein
MPNRPPTLRLVLALASAAPLLAGCESAPPQEALWRKHCADCHGLDGAGNTPRYLGNEWANLLDNSWKSGGGDEYTIQQVVRDGVFGQMPGNSELTDEELRQIVDYLFHLRGEKQL